MLKVFPKTVFLDSGELLHIKRVFKGDDDYLSVHKVETFFTDKDEYEFHITISSCIMHGKTALSLSIDTFNKKSKATLIALFETTIYAEKDLFDTFYFTYKNNSKKVEFSLRIESSQINKKLYSESYFREKFDGLYPYSIRKIIDVNSSMVYLNFKEETELAFATYALTAQPKPLLKEDESYDLYLKKLYYIGYELDDFYNPSKTYNLTNLKKELTLMTSPEQVLKYLISYLAYIKFSSHDLEERTKPLNITKIGLEIYNKYLELSD